MTKIHIPRKRVIRDSIILITPCSGFLVLASGEPLYYIIPMVFASVIIALVAGNVLGYITTKMLNK